MKQDNIILTKSFDFAVRVDYLPTTKEIEENLLKFLEVENVN